MENFIWNKLDSKDKPSRFNSVHKVSSPFSTIVINKKPEGTKLQPL
jgi:hypothetical protein